MAFGLLSLRAHCFSYDEAATKRELMMAQASYCVSPLNASWACVTCRETPEVHLEAVVEAGGGRALVGYDARDRTVFATFRGSDDARNWIDNLQFFKVHPWAAYPEIGVDRGFFKWYEALRPGVVAALANATAKHATRRVKTSGHSAGAGPAVYLALEIALGLAGEGGAAFDTSTLKATTFGSPRLGDETFVAAVANASIVNTRVTHYRDVVPHVPPDNLLLLGYHHVRYEVYYDAKSTHATVCDGSGEDPDCSDECDLCTSVDDHLFYLNTSLGTLAC
jgi:hypothetical protein